MKRNSIFIVLLLGVILWMGPGCSSDPNLEGAKLDLRNQDFDRALENVDEALVRDPQNAEAHDLRGQILQAQAQEVTDPEQHRAIVEDMIEAYNQAIEIDPGLEEDVTQRLRLAYYNEFRSGIQAFNRAQDNPDEYATAASYFGLAAELQPDSAGAYVNWAFALLNSGQEEQAIAPLERAIELGDTQKNTYLFLGDIYSRQGDSAKALEVFEKAAELFPEDQDIQGQLLNAYVQAGQMEEAIEEYQTALELDPNNELLLYNYGSLLLEDEQYDEAINYLSQAVAQDAEYANAQYNLGAAYVNKAVELNEQISEMDDALRESRANLSEQEIEQREAEIEELAEQRRDLFAQAVPPLEKAKSLMDVSGESAAGVCQALFSAYVQTDQQAKAQSIAECAGYEDVDQ